MGDQKVRVAMIGLGFGAEFLPIYQSALLGGAIVRLPDFTLE